MTTAAARGFGALRDAVLRPNPTRRRSRRKRRYRPITARAYVDAEATAAPSGEDSRRARGQSQGGARWSHPLRALDSCAAVSVAYKAMRPGDIVLTGGLTAAVPIGPGDLVEAVFGDGIATVRLPRIVRRWR